MKFDFSSISTWGIVRWMVVAFMFAATVFVAKDQVERKDKRIREIEDDLMVAERKLNGALSAANEALSLAKSINENGMEVAGKTIEGLQQLQQQTEDSGKTLNLVGSLHGIETSTLREENARLRAEVATLKMAANNRMGRSSALPTSSGAPYTPQQVKEADLPYWRPPLRRTVDANIRTAAQNEWGDNYAMIEHEIKRQTEAYDKLLQYNKDYRPVTKQIIARAVEKNGDKWSLVVYEIERQIEALQRLNGR